jgi:hypothetical protein
LGSGAHPDATEVLADLIDFHTARPGITEATLGACRMRDGRTGYDLLADQIPHARAVLDLGTGNGPLVASLLERCPNLESIVGLDACASELQLARERFAADPRVSFSIESADRMSLGDARAASNPSPS